MRLAEICGFAVMIPVRSSGLMRQVPEADEVARYLELGLASAGDGDSEALVLLLASQGFWEFGFGIEPDDEGGALGREAAERARAIAQRLERPDLEVLCLDALSAGINVRGLYGLAEPLDRERLEIARRIRDPFEVADTFYTAAWSAFEVGHYNTVLALAAEFQERDIEVPPLGVLSLTVLSRLALGQWDEALADQAQVRAFLGDVAASPPSFASGGYGAEAFIHEARGNAAAADAIRAEVTAWQFDEERPRKWPLPQLLQMLARRGDFAAAREIAERLPDRGMYLPRELEARGTLIAEEGSWDEADGSGRACARATPRRASSSRSASTRTGWKAARCLPRAIPPPRSARSSGPQPASRASARGGRSRSPSSPSARRSSRCDATTRLLGFSSGPQRSSPGCGFRGSSSGRASCWPFWRPEQAKRDRPPSSRRRYGRQGRATSGGDL